MLRITRRDFLKYCSVAAGALGLSATTMMKLENVFAKESSTPYLENGIPEVIWLDGAACTGCTISLADSQFYTSVDDILINRIDMNYMKTLMAASGAKVDTSLWGGANAIYAARNTFAKGNYVLIVEGAIQVTKPTGGNAGDYCHVGDLTGASPASETMLVNTRRLASRAYAVIAVGTCASFGGIPAARGSVTGAKGLLFQGTAKRKGALNDPALENVGGVSNAQLANVPVINIPGCPPHPDWIVGTLAHILETNLSVPTLDTLKRPVDYGYREYQCNAGPCPWRFNNVASRTPSTTTQQVDIDWNRRYPQGNSRNLGRYKWTRAGNTIDVGCLGILGCKGRKTKADCSRRRWNTDVAEEYGVNWCVGSRGNCFGCTEPAFPDKVGKFYTFA